MRWSMNAFGLAALGLLGCVALPAVADEGPAINPSIYKVPAGAKTINVDCDAQQTLSSALADKSGADLNIVFSGNCKEYVYIQRDGVAIRGKDANASVTGAVEVSSSKRILLEGFTCRDNAQLEYCLGAIHGSAVTLHNMKVFNSGIRGVMVFNSTAIIEGLSVDKTVSTSILIRGAQVRLEGELNFSNTIESCVVIDGVSSVFSKNGVLTARDCGAGMIVQNNSTFQAPFATFNLSANQFAGLMVVTQGTFSYGGTIVARNNTKAGIFVDDLASFAPFSNIGNGSTVTLDKNTVGVYVGNGSVAELGNLTATGSGMFGVMVDNATLRAHHTKVSESKGADVRLSTGATASFGEAVSYGTFTCDGSQRVKGASTPCTADSDAKASAPKPAAKSGN